MPYIEDIIDDYDILAIQEVRDLSGVVLSELDDISGFHIEASERLGRSSSKEQYVYFYSNRVTPGKFATYPDENDDFEREPFVMSFTLNKQTLTFIQVHIKPDDAEQEIRHLSEVVEWTEEEFGKNNIYILGDLNADCVYFDSFGVLEEYEVLIDETYDTTTGRTNCAYDRILATEVDNKVLGVGIDTFEDELGNDVELLKAVSDHYLVYMNFKRVTI